MCKVSICLLTIDRFQMTKYCVNNAIENAGIDLSDIELLVLDNGSTDKRTIEYGKKVSTKHVSLPKNIGVASGYNILFKMATGDYICTIGNDIYLQKNWLKDLLYYAESIKKSGVSGIHCLLDKGIFNKKYGVYMPSNGMIYSTTFFSKKLLNEIGGFDERLSGYGCEDSQFAWRSMMSGYNNYYIPNHSSTHLGEDFNTTSEYRKSKDENLKKNTEILQKTTNEMYKIKNYKLPYGKIKT